MYVECQSKLPNIATNNLHCIYNIHECLYAFNVQSNQSFTGKCMWNVGVRAGDSRDIFGQKRFFPFTPQHVLIGQPIVNINMVLIHFGNDHPKMLLETQI